MKAFRSSHDYRHTPPKYVAVKFQKSASHYYEAAHDEIELLQVAGQPSFTSKQPAISKESDIGVGFPRLSLTLDSKNVEIGSLLLAMASFLFSTHSTTQVHTGDTCVWCSN